MDAGAIMESRKIQEMSNSSTTISFAASSQGRTTSLAEEPREPSSDDSNNESPEILKGTAISLHQVKKPILRATVRDVMSNNIARRTLKATIVLGVFTTIYYCTSLVPAFQAANAAVQTLQLQKESGDESAQALAFQFLKECTNRKFQKLPLGEDCMKYMEKTPKAPPDIDKWVVDPKKPSAGVSSLEPSSSVQESEPSRTAEYSSNVGYVLAPLPPVSSLLSSVVSGIAPAPIETGLASIISSILSFPPEKPATQVSSRSSATKSVTLITTITVTKNTLITIEVSSPTSYFSFVPRQTLAIDSPIEFFDGYLVLGFVLGLALACMIDFTIRSRRVWRVFFKLSASMREIYEHTRINIVRASLIRRAASFYFTCVFLGGLCLAITHEKEAAPWAAAALFRQTWETQKNMSHKIRGDCQNCLGKRLKPPPNPTAKFNITICLITSGATLVIIWAAALGRSQNLILRLARIRI